MSCTGFPEGDYSHCCKDHDKAYKFGFNKTVADLQLALCVAAKRHWYSGALSLLMLSAVLTLGWLFWIRARLRD